MVVGIISFGILQARSPTRCSPIAALTTDAEPSRSAGVSGYKAPPELVTWSPFQYASPQERRSIVRSYVRRISRTLPPLPPLRVALIGAPSSGKGTLVPMISQAFRCRAVSVGDLLRGEMRAAKPRGVAAAEALAQGRLLSDEFTLELLSERLEGLGDGREQGSWLLDGFPRTVAQAYTVLSDPRWAALRPDCVVLLDRPAELIKEFALGRCTDSLTGATYHPTYAPAPPEVHDRLVWRVDDTMDVVERRILAHQRSVDLIVAQFDAKGVPVCRFDNARPELETFAEITSFLEDLAMQKLASERDALLRRWRSDDAAAGWGCSPAFAGLGSYGGPGYQSGHVGRAQALVAAAQSNDLGKVSDLREVDIEEFCAPGEEEGACLVRYGQAVGGDEGAFTLLGAVRRCNAYDPDDYLPVLVGDEQVGWVGATMMRSLDPMLALGTACELAERGPGRSALRLAPQAHSLLSRTRSVASLVEDLVVDGVIPAAKVRHELQDVQPLSAGFVGLGGPLPALRMERAAMIYFGVPSYGVHVNGWVRDPENPNSARPWGVWVGKRSLSKATYAGLFDQMVAGGQPAGLSFLENVRKECEEEASLPPQVVRELQPAGVVSYRYATPKGLSTKVLAVFDVEMPPGLLPICADGEVEEFSLLPIEEVLDSIREELPLWKPNSALVAIDFALRHGFVSPDEPGYVEMAHLLRAGSFGSPPGGPGFA